MFRAKLNVNGRDTVVLGLSFENLDRLRAGALDDHIAIRKESLEIAHDIIIVAGENERAFLRAFGNGIGPETKIHIDPRLKD